jgi:hypothetical protein
VSAPRVVEDVEVPDDLSTAMTAPMSHRAKTADAMPALQKPVRHSTATA